jgi:hypothetical protein
MSDPVPTGSVQGQDERIEYDPILAAFDAAQGAGHVVDDACEALDCLRAEVERLREALRADYDEALAGSPLVLGEPFDWDSREGFDRIRAITAVVREADRAFEREGGSSRHWVRDQFLPRLEDAGMTVVPLAGDPCAEPRD